MEQFVNVQVPQKEEEVVWSIQVQAAKFVQRPEAKGVSVRGEVLDVYSLDHTFAP